MFFSYSKNFSNLQHTSFLGLEFLRVGALQLLKNLAYVAPVSYRPVPHKNKRVYPLSVHLSDPQQVSRPSSDLLPTLLGQCITKVTASIMKLIWWPWLRGVARLASKLGIFLFLLTFEIKDLSTKVEKPWSGIEFSGSACFHVRHKNV